LLPLKQYIVFNVFCIFVKIFEMRLSHFPDAEKIKIILEYIPKVNTISDVCKRHSISVNTFYIWKRSLQPTLDSITAENPNTVLNEILQYEIRTLKNLYISLSHHNYELAQFLKS
jgi:transposase-like protein